MHGSDERRAQGQQHFCLYAEVVKTGLQRDRSCKHSELWRRDGAEVCWQLSIPPGFLKPGTPCLCFYEVFLYAGINSPLGLKSTQVGFCYLQLKSPTTSPTKITSRIGEQSKRPLQTCHGMKSQLSSRMCLEMGSGEEKTKPSYYRVAYSVITLVQGVLLYEKKKKTLH